MNRSFWNKAAGAKGRTIACAVAAALSVMLLFVVCKEKTDDPVGPPANPCANGATDACCAANPSYTGCDVPPNPCASGPTTACCAADPSYPGCTPSNPCASGPTTACCADQPTYPGCGTPDPCLGGATAACCAANPSFAGCGTSDPCLSGATAACCAANPSFTGCGPADPCAGGATAACCAANSSYPGCEPVDPCASGPIPACCAVNSSYPGCEPADPCASGPTTACCASNSSYPGCAPTNKKYCYWAPNSHNDYKGGCAEIGASTCTEETCQDEAGCTGSSGVVKTTSNCDGLPLTGDQCELDPTPDCANYCETNPTAAICKPPTSRKWCYWAASSYNDGESCAEIGTSTCKEASCETEHGCQQSSGEVKTVANCGIVSPITGITTGTDASKTCKMNGADIFCQWPDGCYAMSEVYGGEPAGCCTCQELADNCYSNGTLYTGVSASVVAAPDYGAGKTCDGTAYSK